MSTSQHVEVEAAKFLHKLIQESTDEPAKLATKLYVICQHMKLSGKEQSLPYQVISRAMETVINQHGLDINVLKSSRLPFSGGPQIGDSSQASSKDKEVPANQQAAFSSQTNEEINAALQSCGLQKNSISIPGPADVDKHGRHISTRPPAGLNRVDNLEVDVRLGSVPQRSTRSSEHERPSSIPTEDPRSTNSQERHSSVNLDIQTNMKVTKKTACKRKRVDSKPGSDSHSDNPQQSDSVGTGLNTRKMNKGGVNCQFEVRGDDPSQVNAANHANYQDHMMSVPSGAGSFPIVRQGDRTLSERTSDKSKYLNSFSVLPNPKLPEEGEVSSSLSACEAQKGGFLPSKTNMLSSNYALKQNTFSLPSGGSQDSVPHIIKSLPGINWESKFPGSGFIGNTHTAEDSPQRISSGTIHTHSGTSGAVSSYAMGKTVFSAPALHNNTSFESLDMTSELYKERNIESFGSQLLGKGKDIAPGKSVLHERGTSQEDISYNPSQRSGVQMQENRDYVPGNAEAIHRNQNFFDKPMSVSSLRHEQANNIEMSAVSSAAPKDTGFTSPASASSNMPFTEQHLKQLRAQCIVFLAFRNNMMPRKYYLELAIGGSYSKEGCNEDGIHTGLNDGDGGKAMDAYSKDPGNSHKSSVQYDRPSGVSRMIQGTPSTGSIVETDSSSKDTENARKKSKMGPKSVKGENKQIAASNPKFESERWTQEATESHAASRMPPQCDSPIHTGRGVSESHYARADQTNQKIAWANRVYSSSHGAANHFNNKGNGVFRTRPYDDPSKGIPGSAVVQRESTLETAETHPGHFETISSYAGSAKFSNPVRQVFESNEPEDQGHSEQVKEQNPQVIHKEGEISEHKMTPYKDPNMFPHADVTEKSFSSAWSYPASNGANDQRVSITAKSDAQIEFSSNGFKIATANDTVKHGIVDTALEKATEQEEENRSESNGIPSSPPKYRTSEKWIFDYQKKRRLEQQKWVLKQKKAEQKVTASFDKLKESVNSCEDISAKTKSVIELKKLQLLTLQRRLRSDFLSDYFKPIASDMERLKSVKKHRHGRRVKQLEKFDQKMKEERQKRIRERQKEFFSEVEVHKEKLEDCFKVKRERWKNFNKFVKEFHKRKERIHREKIDRIQREKINLLKNNDVEGYLRMVQDAKSDRVKQLLKETEKYLQKLGSKVEEAKAVSRRFEMEKDDNRALNIVEKNDFSIDNEDESDQAQHYLESNEKYYLMAHSVKESINEQPTSLEGGKLREYQMNGLRWLVSLYNNHLNGILADEMGLGKTVQVIALICYLMESKNDRGPFLVVVPSSVLPGWVSEMSFWAPSINKITYAGPPEERRRLFKERIVNRKFNVLLTTYEYLMNKHDRPKLSKVHWHYIIIDEGHRIKNASCKLNADLKHYQSSHRLLLSGTPLQNNLDELWALLNFLLPNIFNSSEDFSQWFNKPFESNGDNSPDEALLSEEENLLIINRLHQVLRPFLLRRLKHKVENELPEKIERLVRCEASAYQKLLMKRVEENLGSIGNSKGRSIHNTVMELRNICNHPYLSQLHAEEVNGLIPTHYLPPIVRLCGKLEMLDRLLPKLKATDHRVLLFSTMTRLLDVMEEYLSWKHYKYLRLDGHTSGSDRGALIEEFNRPGSQAFIFLLSIRAGGVGVNLQAADTVIIFDTDWNPQVDLQAQARAHRIGQKKDVLVLRLETVRTVEEQVRAAAEHKLGVANQSITAGFFDNNTSAEDRREYLENLLRECKKEEAASVLDDDALNDLLARSESEIDIFESVDKQRREGERAAWQGLFQGRTKDALEPLPMPSRLVTEEDLKLFYEAMMLYEKPKVDVKHKSQCLGGLDTQQYGRGKRAREVRSYEDQWTEEEFEKLCQVDSPESPHPSEMPRDLNGPKEVPLPLTEDQPIPSKKPQASRDPPVKKGRGRPRRATIDISPTPVVPYTSPGVKQQALEPKKERFSAPATGAGETSFSISTKEVSTVTEGDAGRTNSSGLPAVNPTAPFKARGQRIQTGEAPRKRGGKQNFIPSTAVLQVSMIPALAKGTDAAATNSPIIVDQLRDDKTTSSPEGIRIADNVSEAPSVSGTVGIFIEGRNSEGLNFPGITSTDVCSTTEKAPVGVDPCVEMSIPTEEDVDDIKSETIVSTDPSKSEMTYRSGKFPDASSELTVPAEEVSVEVEPTEVTGVQESKAGDLSKAKVSQIET